MAETMALDADWETKVTDRVKDKAALYMKLMREKAKKNEKMNSALDELKEFMIEDDCPRVPIDDGAKHLVLEQDHKIKSVKAETPDE